MRRVVSCHGVLFGVKYLEITKEAGELQDIVNSGAQSEQCEVLLQLPGFHVDLDQGGNPRAIDVADTSHIEHKPWCVGQRLEQFGPEDGRRVDIDFSFKI